MIEGQGAAVLEQINSQIHKGFLKETQTQARPALVAMNNCSNITIDQLSMMNACGNAQSYNGCKNLTVSGIFVRSTVVEESKGIPRYLILMMAILA